MLWVGSEGSIGSAKMCASYGRLVVHEAILCRWSKQNIDPVVALWFLFGVDFGCTHGVYPIICDESGASTCSAPHGAGSW